MAALNSKYYMSQLQYSQDSRRFRDVYEDYLSMRLIGHSIDGKTYYADYSSLVIGQPQLIELDTRCASCGTNHGASGFDEKGRCEVSVKRYNHTLHKLFWERKLKSS